LSDITVRQQQQQQQQQRQQQRRQHEGDALLRGELVTAQREGSERAATAAPQVGRVGDWLTLKVPVHGPEELLSRLYTEVKYNMVVYPHGYDHVIY
jgi:hypothetical protein